MPPKDTYVYTTTDEIYTELHGNPEWLFADIINYAFHVAFKNENENVELVPSRNTIKNHLKKKGLPQRELKPAAVYKEINWDTAYERFDLLYRSFGNSECVDLYKELAEIKNTCFGIETRGPTYDQIKKKYDRYAEHVTKIELSQQAPSYEVQQTQTNVSERQVNCQSELTGWTISQATVANVSAIQNEGHHDSELTNTPSQLPQQPPGISVYNVEKPYSETLQQSDLGYSTVMTWKPESYVPDHTRLGNCIHHSTCSSLYDVPTPDRDTKTYGIVYPSYIWPVSKIPSKQPNSEYVASSPNTDSPSSETYRKSVGDQAVHPVGATDTSPDSSSGEIEWQGFSEQNFCPYQNLDPDFGHFDNESFFTTKTSYDNNDVGGITALE